MSANAANLLTLAAAGPDLGRPRLALDLSAAAGWWFLETGRYAEGCLLHRTALATARSMGERTGPAALALGQALVRLGAWDEALELLPAAERALVADGDGSAHRAANATAIIHAQRGDLDAAIAGFERAATLARGVDDLAAEAQCWDNLAITHRRAGRLPDALTFHHRALAFYDARGDVHEQAHSLVNLSDLLLVMGDVPGALDTAQRGVRRAAEVDAAAWAYGLDNLGNALAATGRVEEAEKSFLAALDKAREQGDKHLEACVLNDLGALCVRDDRFAAAADRHGAALAVSESIEDRFQEARSQEGLGRSRAGESDRVGARTHLSIAVSIFEELGAPEADEARALLAGLG